MQKNAIKCGESKTKCAKCAMRESPTIKTDSFLYMDPGCFLPNSYFLLPGRQKSTGVGQTKEIIQPQCFWPEQS